MRDEDRVLAAVAYVLLWITGLVVLLTAKPEEKYRRWHAVQSIALGIVATAFYVVVSFWSSIVAAVTPNSPGVVDSWAIPVIIMGTIALLLQLGLIALIIVLAIRAYQGHQVRLPFLAPYADKYS